MTTPQNNSIAFKTVTEGVIKSIKQRQLTRYWERLRGDFLLPLWSDIDAAEFGQSRDYVCVIEVHGKPPANRYLIREHGSKLGEYYGDSCAGKYLDEFMAPDAHAALAAIYSQSVATCRPVYMVAPIADRKGRAVTLERLLLPFTETGSQVDIVLTSLEAISVEGAFEHHKVLEPSQKKAFTGFLGVIATG